MPKDYLRLSEHYVSVQGEGPRTGLPTQFVRFAGCNMRCPLWPCDTPYAIEPSIWRHEAEKIDVDDLLERVEKLPASNICLTGGEPFMQPTDMLEELVFELQQEGYTVEAFSNGSYLYPEWAIERIDFTLDWKLAGSGEQNTARDNRWQNVQNLIEGDSIKFVVASKDDLLEAEALTFSFQEANILADLWVGAAWGQIENTEVIDFLLERDLPWQLNVQVHKYIYNPDQRGI